MVRDVLPATHLPRLWQAEKRQGALREEQAGQARAVARIQRQMEERVSEHTRVTRCIQDLRSLLSLFRTFQDITLDSSLKGASFARRLTDTAQRLNDRGILISDTLLTARILDCLPPTYDTYRINFTSQHIRPPPVAEQTPAEAAGADQDVARAVVEEEAVAEVDEEGALGNVAGVGQPLQPRVGSLRASMSFAKALTKVRPSTRPPIPLIRASKLSPTNGLHAATRALLHAGAPSPLAPPLMTFAPSPPMHHLPPTSIMSSPNTSPLTSSSKSNTSSPHPPPPQRLPPSPHPPSHLKPLPPPILLSPLILLLTLAGPTLPTPHLCMAMGQLQLLHLLNYPPPPLTPPASHRFLPRVS
ncbi:unnamed protein product [Closterium sp. NIES-65]|nr:unnamed protein product [Closterium sp. NIES-65]